MAYWPSADPSMGPMYVNPPHHHQHYHGFQPGPVILPATRPGRYRHRMGTDNYGPSMQYLYHDNYMLVPDGAAMRRSRSTGHPMPLSPMPAAAPVVINNVVNEEHAEHGGRMYDEPQVPSRHPRQSSPPPRAEPASGRSQSPYLKAQQELENETLRKELEGLRQEKEKKQEAERVKKEMELEIALREKKQREEEEKRKEIEKQAIVDFQRLQLEKAAKKKKQDEEREADYKERVKRDLGISEQQLSKIIKNSSENALDLRRNTYTKISRAHVSIETLKAFNLPWKYDDNDPDHFVLVKRWVPEAEQELLWDHTRRLREDSLYRQRRLLLQEAKEEQIAKLKVVRKPARAKSPGLFHILRK